MKTYKFTIWFEVDRKRNVVDLESDTIMNALISFQKERPFAVVTSITRNKMLR